MRWPLVSLSLIGTLSPAVVVAQESTFIIDLARDRKMALDRSGHDANLFRLPIKACGDADCLINDSDSALSDLLKGQKAGSDRVEQLSFCFSPTSVCYLEHAENSRGAITGIYYTAGLPQFYTSDVKLFLGRIDKLDRYGLYGEKLVFVPSTMLRDSAGEEAIEEQVIEDTKDYTMRFASVAAPPTFDKGRALCKFPKFPWGAGNPFDCIFTRYWTSDREYRLGIKQVRYENPYLIALSPSFASQAASVSLIGGGFAVDAKEGLGKLYELTLQEIIAGTFKADPNRIERTKTADRVLVLGSVGPRLSVADKLLREQIDFSLAFEKLSDASTDQEVVVRPRLSLSAWVNRQNTDKPSDWRMPSESYLSALHDIVAKAVSVAFAGYCQGRRQSVNKSAQFDPTSCR